MAEIINISDYLKKEYSNNEVVKDCKVIKYNEHYANYLFKNASININKKKDFFALLDINKATDLCLDAGKIDIDSGLISVVQLNAGNYDLASRFLLKSISKSMSSLAPFLLFLSGIFDLQGKKKASLFYKNALMALPEGSLVHYADLLMHLKNDLRGNYVGGLNIKALKRAFKKNANDGDYEVAKRNISILWELDKSDVFINYWHFHYRDGAYIEDAEKIPYSAFLNRCDELVHSLNDDEKLKFLCQRQDCDCLVNFIVEYFEIKTATLIMSKIFHLIKKNDAYHFSRIIFSIENYLFSAGDDKKKLEIFLLFIENNIKVAKSLYSFRYKDILVEVWLNLTYKCVNSGFIKPIMKAVKYLILKEFDDIDLADILADLCLRTNLKNSFDDTENYDFYTKLIIYKYYKKNQLALPSEFDNFEEQMKNMGF